MDGLAIITGIALISFLLLYFAFSLSSEHNFLRILTVMAALFILAFIPSVSIEMEKDCAILNNGTYSCYYYNGTQVSNYGNNSIGVDFLSAYNWYLRIFAVYLFIFITYYVLKWFGIPIDNIRFRTIKRRMV